MNKILMNIWSLYAHELHLFILTKVKNKQDADDITQDVFIKFQEKFSSIKEESKTKQWLHSVARNSVYDFYRNKKIKVNEVDNIENIPFVDNIENLNMEVSECIKKLFPCLKSEEKNILEWYFFDKKSHDAISTTYNISLSASKMKLLRAKKSLKEMMHTCCEFEFDVFGNVLNYQQKSSCCLEKCN